VQTEDPRHRRQLRAPRAPQPKDKGRDRREGMAVDLSKVNCPARAATWAEHVKPGLPAIRAARIVGDRSMSRLAASCSFQRSTTPFASARAAASATCRFALMAMSRPRVRTPIAAVSAESSPVRTPTDRQKPAGFDRCHSDACNKGAGPRAAKSRRRGRFCMLRWPVSCDRIDDDLVTDPHTDRLERVHCSCLHRDYQVGRPRDDIEDRRCCKLLAGRARPGRRARRSPFRKKSAASLDRPLPPGVACNAAEREEADGADVIAELTPAHGDAGRVDQRRHHQEKHQLRRQLDPRQPGRHRDDETDEDEKNGGGILVRFAAIATAATVTRMKTRIKWVCMALPRRNLGRQSSKGRPTCRPLCHEREAPLAVSVSGRGTPRPAADESLLIRGLPDGDSRPPKGHLGNAKCAPQPSPPAPERLTTPDGSQAHQRTDRADDARQHAGKRRAVARRVLLGMPPQDDPEADPWSDDVPVPSFGPRMVCTNCGIIGADARPPGRSSRRARP
jgi:hypothetical protein